jgi:hypothetical protein
VAEQHGAQIQNFSLWERVHCCEDEAFSVRSGTQPNQSLCWSGRKERFDSLYELAARVQ